MKFNRQEFSGAFGDLGVLVPIFISLVAINGLNPSISLLLIGLLYIFCGFYYNLPIPVQPLKVMAAVAIATGLSSSVISAGTILMGLILLFLSITNAINFLDRIFSRPIIRGIQLGVGLMLMKTSAILITKEIFNKSLLNIPLNLIVLFISISIIIIYLWKKGLLSSTSILGFGIIVSMLNGEIKAISFLPIQKFNLSIPTFDDFIKAFFLLVIPQLPLTLGNAIVATKDVAERYFGEKAKKVTCRSLSFGLGIANIFAGLVGGIPVCHGSAGLTAHYNFGARTGGCGIIIGSILVGLALIFGEKVGEFFKIIPFPILGIMLFYVGFKHACLIGDLIKDKKEFLIALLVGITGFFTNNLAIAWGLGIIFYFLRFLFR